MTDFSLIEHPPEIAMEFYGAQERKFRLGSKVYRVDLDLGTKPVTLGQLEVDFDFDTLPPPTVDAVGCLKADLKALIQYGPFLRRRGYVQVEIAREEPWSEGNLFTGFRLRDVTDGFLWMICGTFFDGDDYRPVGWVCEGRQPPDARPDAEPRADEATLRELAGDPHAVSLLSSFMRPDKADRPVTVRPDYRVPEPVTAPLKIADYTVYHLSDGTGETWVVEGPLPPKAPFAFDIETTKKGHDLYSDVALLMGGEAPGSGERGILIQYTVPDDAIRDAVRRAGERRWWITVGRAEAKTISFVSLYGGGQCGFQPGQIVTPQSTRQSGKSFMHTAYMQAQAFLHSHSMGCAPVKFEDESLPVCPHCRGTGKTAHWKSSQRMKCPRCNGTGRVQPVKKGVRQKPKRR